MTADRSLRESIEVLLDPDVELRRYFGGWALRRDGRQIAMIMDQLYVRIPAAVARTWEVSGSVPFSYEAAGRRVVVDKYWSAPASAQDSGSALRAVLALAD